MTDPTSPLPPPVASDRWAVLAILGTAQLMVVLDATIINIALPSAQQALHFSASDREWIVTAYALAFGSLLLLGGKLGDLFGRKWTFVGGMCGFALVSAVGGLSTSFAMLVSARALQGVFGALLTPSALGLLTETFADSPDRPKAFGIFGAIAGGGAAVGLVLGGALTQFLSWRWCLYVNLLLAVPTVLFAIWLLVNRRTDEKARIDVPGLLTASGGLLALVYGFSNAETQSWTAERTVVALAASVVLLGAFLLIEQRVAHPLLPLHIARDRGRGGAYASVLLSSAGMFGVFFFLTYYLQENLGFSPLGTGLSFLPMTAVLVVTSVTVQTRLLPRIGARPLVIAGMALGTVAMIGLAQIGPSGGYVGNVLPWLLVTGLGMGCIFAPCIGTATLGVALDETGVASAMVNTSQQVGGSIGVALLSTISASAAGHYAKRHPLVHGLAALAATHGYATAFTWAAGIFGLGMVLAVVVLPRKAGLPDCSLKTALARGIAWAHHVQPAGPGATPPGR